jgi:LmbE family N-acetylglucosaminyl deacetylase
MDYGDGLSFDSAMVIYAHPDDAEWTAGGTVAAWTDQGVEVTYVLVTNGASGSSDPNMTREKLVDIRYREQDDAAAVLGVKEVVHLGFEDGYLYPDLDLRKAVARQIRIHRPNVIISHDPTARTVDRFYLQHPDHIATGEVVMRSFNPDASSGLMFPELWKDEGLEPFLPKALFVGAFFDGTDYVDISDTIERKVQALLCHACQIDDPEGIKTFIYERFKMVGERANTAYAEAFKLFRTNG